MSTARAQTTDEQWLEHKAFIRYEYLVKDTSLKDLILRLADRGLHTTKARLEYRLKLWRFSKNLDQETWRYIARKIKRRRDIGKESEVIYNGNRIEKSKVIKETTRHRKNLYHELAYRQDPNCCVGRRNGGFVTPIGRAINIGHVDLTRLLLNFHVRTNTFQADFDYRNVIQAIVHGRTSKAVQLRLLKLLKEYRAVSLEEVLCGALKLQDMELVEEILQEDIDVTKDHWEWNRLVTHERLNVRPQYSQQKYLLQLLSEETVTSSENSKDFVRLALLANGKGLPA
ncbi:hypothetical protein IL306_002546 [Fusarium sp. DS 682]|nr:hypothetical protein IL306_002546 [Fusarium sp. DS 682]